MLLPVIKSRLYAVRKIGKSVRATICNKAECVEGSSPGLEGGLKGHERGLKVETFKGASRRFQRGFKEASRRFQGEGDLKGLKGGGIKGT